MDDHHESDVEIGYATDEEIEQNFVRWVEAVGAAGTPLSRVGGGLAQSRARNRLSSALIPGGVDAMPARMLEGYDAAVNSRSLVLSARIGSRVVGGLVARPQLHLLGGVAEPGPQDVLSVLVRVMKLEVVAVEPEFTGNRIGSAMVGFGLKVMRDAHVQLVYGTYHHGRDLASFYKSQGFSVLKRGWAVNLTPVTSVRIAVGTTPDERIFVSSLGDGPDVDLVDPREAARIS